MPALPFTEKEPGLLDDPARGISAMHRDAFDRLLWVADYSHAHWSITPVVTELGRTVDDQEELYYPLYLQEAMREAGVDHETETTKIIASERARARFSWHLIIDRSYRAFDLRSRSYTVPQRLELIIAARERFPKDEILHHRLPGGAIHFHFGVPDPAGRPSLTQPGGSAT